MDEKRYQKAIKYLREAMEDPDGNFCVATLTSEADTIMLAKQCNGVMA